MRVLAASLHDPAPGRPQLPSDSHLKPPRCPPLPTTAQASGHTTPYMASRVASCSNLADLGGGGSARGEGPRKPPGLPDSTKARAALALASSSNGGGPRQPGPASPTEAAAAPPAAAPAADPAPAAAPAAGPAAPAAAPRSGSGGGQEPGRLLVALGTALDSALSSATNAVDSAANNEQLQSVLADARTGVSAAMSRVAEASSSLAARTSSGLSAAQQHLRGMVEAGSPRGGSNLRKSGSLKDMAAAAGGRLGACRAACWCAERSAAPECCMCAALHRQGPASPRPASPPPPPPPPTPQRASSWTT